MGWAHSSAVAGCGGLVSPAAPYVRSPCSTTGESSAVGVGPRLPASVCPVPPVARTVHISASGWRVACRQGAPPRGVRRFGGGRGGCPGVRAWICSSAVVGAVTLGCGRWRVGVASGFSGVCSGGWVLGPWVPPYPWWAGQSPLSQSPSRVLSPSGGQPVGGWCRWASGGSRAFHGRQGEPPGWLPLPRPRRPFAGRPASRVLRECCLPPPPGVWPRRSPWSYPIVGWLMVWVAPLCRPWSVPLGESPGHVVLVVHGSRYGLLPAF